MRRVVKLGGSLLLRPDLKSRLQNWFRHQATAEDLVVVGGGQLVDAVRKLDQLYSGEPAQIHWQCVDLLQITFELLGDSFGWPTVQTSGDLERQSAGGFSTAQPTLIAVRSFYDRDTSVDAPWDWRTTSDTLAAILANRVKADELVLLKSCPIDAPADLGALVAAGVVDQVLPRFAAGLPCVRVESLLCEDA